jgi:hypothetical protein
MLKHFGITKPPMGQYTGEDRMCVSDTEGAIGLGIAIAFHRWAGDIWINSKTHRGLQRLAEAMVKDDGKIDLEAIKAISTVVHEELHGLSDMTYSAYQGVGVFVEEIATEVTARKVVRERFGHMRDVTDPTITTHTGQGFMVRGDHTLLTPTAAGSYGDIIDDCVQIIAHFISGRTLPPVGVDPLEHRKRHLDEARHLLEEASLRLKQKKLKPTGSPTAHLKNFVNCFETLSESERKSLSGTITRLIRLRTKNAKAEAKKKRKLAGGVGR